MADITLEQKKILEPFGNLYAQMDQTVCGMTDEELSEALAACRATSTTNCWCCTYAAAQYLMREIGSEIYRRQRQTASA